MKALQERSEEVLREVASDPRLGRFVDSRWSIPKVHCGTSEIRLVILGQDPTVKNVGSRSTIKMVLNLDRGGSLREYLAKVCSGLGLDLDKNVYATNYLKNFFINPPTQITEINVFKEFSRWWLPLLRDELALFPQASVITLGEPLISALANEGVNSRVRDYWGYTPHWKSGEMAPFRFIEPNDNHLHRLIFPFPHQPSIGKQFYKERMEHYVAFVRQHRLLGREAS